MCCDSHVTVDGCGRFALAANLYLLSKGISLSVLVAAVSLLLSQMKYIA
jgi:prophage maintenance system killer protein